MGAPDSPAPSSWRDTYLLVRDTREDVLNAVAIVDGKVTAIGDRVTGIEISRREETVAHQTEVALAAKRDKQFSTILAASRGGIAIIISVITFGLVVVRG